MAYEDYTQLVVSIAEGVAVVRMNRPERLNAFDRAMGLELVRIPAELREDEHVRCVILTGTGRGFCAGIDLDAGVDPAPDNPFRRQLMDELHFSGRVTLAWHELDKPSIAAINGVAAGGGLGLALVQDLRIACHSARLNPIFTTRGLPPEVGTSWTATRLLGAARALQWFYTRKELSAAEALAWGLVSEAVPDIELLDRATALARRIAEGPPLALRLARRSVYHAEVTPLRDHLIYEAMTVTTALKTEDAAEGGTAIRERRAPRFQGR